MAEQKYRVTVDRVNESMHQRPDVSFVATGIKFDDDGGLTFAEERGGRSFGFGTWGSVTITRIFT